MALLLLVDVVLTAVVLLLPLLVAAHCHTCQHSPGYLRSLLTLLGGGGGGGGGGRN